MATKVVEPLFEKMDQLMEVAPRCSRMYLSQAQWERIKDDPRVADKKYRGLPIEVARDC